MNRNDDNSVRTGSLTIFALVIVLCIAVMGMLSVSTGHAALAASEKQAAYTSEIYQNEKKAWRFVSKIDQAMYDLRSSWWWSKYEGIQKATEIVDSTKGASIEDDVITAKFKSKNGKTLTLKINITDNLDLKITEWKVSTSKETNNGDVLWTGM